jgi:hypothetical protein
MADSTKPLLSSALAQVQADLDAAPPSVQTVIVAAADDQGISAGIAKRYHNGWKLSATVEQRWQKQRPNARVMVTKDWR